jgi:hypothetical protein
VVCDDSRDDWIEAGRRAVAMMTSSLHHDHADGEWIAEARDLMTGLDPCEMALTLAWVTRLGAESMIESHGNSRERALETLREIALGLEKALVSDLTTEDVRD